MSRKCTICADKNRCAIDQSVGKGEPIRRIASHFGVGEKSLERHVKNGHVAKSIQAAEDGKIAESGKSIQDKLKEAYDLALGAAQLARDEDLRAFGGCIGAVMKAIEIEARIRGVGGEGEPPTKRSGFMQGYLAKAAKVNAEAKGAESR